MNRFGWLGARPGVKLHGFDGSNDKSAKRFKLFTENKLRRVVLNRLRLQFAESGACRANAEVKLGLACGRIASDKDRADLHKHFARKGWELWDEPWLRDRLQRISDQGYENQVSAVVAKLLLRARSNDGRLTLRGSESSFAEIVKAETQHPARGIRGAR
jgi:hypothetical protein